MDYFSAIALLTPHAMLMWAWVLRRGNSPAHRVYFIFRVCKTVKQVKFLVLKYKSWPFKSDELIQGFSWFCFIVNFRYHHTGPISSMYALREGVGMLADEVRVQIQNGRPFWTSYCKKTRKLYRWGSGRLYYNHHQSGGPVYIVNWYREVCA